MKRYWLEYWREDEKEWRPSLSFNLRRPMTKIQADRQYARATGRDRMIRFVYRVVEVNGE